MPIFLMDSLSIVIGLSISLFCCACFGRLLQKLLAVPLSNHIDAYDLCFGLIFITSLISFIHIILPIQWPITIAFIFCAVSFFAYDFSAFVSTWKSVLVFARKNVITVLIAAIFGMILTFGTLKPPNNYDAGLYYFGSIRWLNEFPIIPGLGNLYVQFAYNQSYFGLGALLNLFPFWNKGFALVNPLFIVISFLMLLQFKIENRFIERFIRLSIGLLLCSFLSDLSSPTVEVGVGCAEIMIFLIALRLYSDRELDGKQTLRQVVALFLLCGFLVTIKISGLFFAVLIPVIFCPLLIRVIQQHPYQSRRVAFYILFIGLTFVLRNYLLSGTFIFPSQFAKLDQLEWAVPSSLVKEIIDSSIAYNRAFGGSESIWENWRIFMPWMNGNWVTPWFKIFLPMHGRIIFIATIFLVLIEQYVFWIRLKAQGDKGIYILYIPLVISMIFWFFTSPLLRYIEVIMWLTFILSIVILLLRLRCESFSPSAFDKYTPKISSALWILYSSMIFFSSPFPWIGWGVIPVASTQNAVTNSGLSVSLPVKGDQCWNAQLPCTPYFYPNLASKEFILFGFMPRYGYYFPRQ